MSDTPRTKEAARMGFIEGDMLRSVFVVPLKVAEELERDLAQRTAEVAKANAERDEARRLYCELIATISQTTSRPTQPLNIANLRGWNCFDAKEAKP
jgi:hypothetical protein